MRIAILGAGIIGITTAFRIKEHIPNSIITVFADEYSPYTTSDVSAGYWEPFCINDNNISEQNRVLRWGEEAYKVFLKNFQSVDANVSGVQRLTAYVLDKNDIVNDPYWSKIVTGYEKLSKQELKTLNFDFANAGFRYTTATVDVKKYLPYLMNILEKNGVRYVKSKVNDFADLVYSDPESSYNYVINCTGLGARELCGDMNVYPVRGHVLRVEAPWIKNCIMFENNPAGCSYILPLASTVVVGGTCEENVFSNKANENEFRAILNRCKALLPSLENAKIIEKAIGFRPSRVSGVRLELEVIKSDEGQLKVIHNYGHGGSGITLSWGCASEVVEIIKQDMKLLKSHL